MSKSIRSLIGLLLLITTISLASCQSLLNTVTAEKEQTSVSFAQ